MNSSLGYLRQGNHEYLANTLAELGRNIEFDQSIAQNKLLTASVFRSVFNNINYRIKNIIRVYKHKFDGELFSGQSLPFDLIGQMVLIVKLTAFSEHRKLLYDWAVLTTEELSIDPNEINPFGAILKLAHIFGIFDHWKDLPKEEQKEYTQTICIGCLILNGGPDVNSKTRIFQWLAKLFQYLKIDEGATAEKLFDEITNQLESKHGTK
jgi:hypothetical protein